MFVFLFGGFFNCLMNKLTSIKEKKKKHTHSMPAARDAIHAKIKTKSPENRQHYLVFLFFRQIGLFFCLFLSVEDLVANAVFWLIVDERKLTKCIKRRVCSVCVKPVGNSFERGS